MAPSLKDALGVILPFDNCGSYLNSGNVTIVNGLERRNFKATCKVLENIWSESVIDGNPVIVK